MKYKLYENSNNDIYGNIIHTVLNNRGIDDCNKYLNLNKDVIIDYSNLENMEMAVNVFMNHFMNNEKIYILVDSDPDGYCSAAMMYLYIKKINTDYPVKYILHNKVKSHTLDDIEVPDDAKLLIVPDAGTNDVNECKKIKEKGIDILVLDHHEKEFDNPHATIVNNQMSENYSNKNLCGAGIVYKFLQALDEETWNEYSDDFLDLVALANISDVMDMRSFETRFLVDKGLRNIKNKFFHAIIESQDYSMKGNVNIHNVQWYITPLLNGMIRFGTQDEKELLFNAFIEKNKIFEHKKRATKNKQSEIVYENIYYRVARLCKNAKSRQDKRKDKCVSEIVDIINFSFNDDKIIIMDASDILDDGLTGVVAIKIAEIFKRPCLLLNKKVVDDKIVYGGSGRNIRYSPIESLKDVVSNADVDVRGHANAFGIVDFPIESKECVVNKLNNLLKDVEYDSTYKVDFIISVDDIDVGLIKKLSQFDNIIGQGIEEPLIAVENLNLSRDDFEIFGKNEDTISFKIDDIKFIQFKCKEGNELYDWLQDAWNDSSDISFNLVGKPSINEYDGIKIPQIIIEDVNIISFF